MPFKAPTITTWKVNTLYCIQKKLASFMFSTTSQDSVGMADHTLTDVFPGCQSFLTEKTTMAQWRNTSASCLPEQETKKWFAWRFLSLQQNGERLVIQVAPKRNCFVPRKCKALVPVRTAHVNVPVPCCAVFVDGSVATASVILLFLF